MTKRWNTYRIAQVGLLFGVAYALIRHVLEQGWPRGSDEIIYFVSYLFGGAIGGAILFAVVSGARNLILQAK